jgi:hypothetical protein
MKVPEKYQKYIEYDLRAVSLIDALFTKLTLHAIT